MRDDALPSRTKAVAGFLATGIFADKRYGRISKADIADGCGISRSTAYRALEDLQGRGWLAEDSGALVATGVDDPFTDEQNRVTSEQKCVTDETCVTGDTDILTDDTNGDPSADPPSKDKRKNPHKKEKPQPSPENHSGCDLSGAKDFDPEPGTFAWIKAADTLAEFVRRAFDAKGIDCGFAEQLVYNMKGAAPEADDEQLREYTISKLSELSASDVPPRSWTKYLPDDATDWPKYVKGVPSGEQAVGKNPHDETRTPQQSSEEDKPKRNQTLKQQRREKLSDEKFYKLYPEEAP